MENLERQKISDKNYYLLIGEGYEISLYFFYLFGNYRILNYVQLMNFSTCDKFWKTSGKLGKFAKLCQTCLVFYLWILSSPADQDLGKEKFLQSWKVL